MGKYKDLILVSILLLVVGSSCMFIGWKFSQFQYEAEIDYLEAKNNDTIERCAIWDYDFIPSEKITMDFELPEGLDYGN